LIEEALDGRVAVFGEDRLVVDFEFGPCWENCAWAGWESSDTQTRMINAMPERTFNRETLEKAALYYVSQMEGARALARCPLGNALSLRQHREIVWAA
jgi:hypothetical protein